MVSNVSRVWKPDETLALVFEILGSFRLDYEYEIEYEYDFSILLVLNLVLVVQSEGPY